MVVRRVGTLPARIEHVHDMREALARLCDLTHILRHDADACEARKAGLDQNPHSVPFLGGWIGGFSYELGRVIEPSVAARNVHPSTGDESRMPLIELAWCPDALVFDHRASQWFLITPADTPSEKPPVDLEALLNTPPDASHASATSVRPRVQPDAELLYTANEPTNATTDEMHHDAVHRAIDYIHAGDIFQANITRRVHTRFNGSTRGFMLDAMAAAQPRYGAYLEQPDGRCVVSMSPELFLSVDGASGRVETRPIKGTRPSRDDPSTLASSSKDAAELHMIVDLMRNDLGRVCRFGSIRVDHAREIETHPTVHHGVATISGTLRAGTGLEELLFSTFPPGSVTGAPKVRAMQIIEELEQAPRHWYCGALGMIDRCGNIQLNVGIRTASLAGVCDASRVDILRDATLTYGAGGGIVADSNTAAECAEARDKTMVLREALASGAHRVRDGATSLLTSV